jgi:hypothetical protein
VTFTSGTLQTMISAVSRARPAERESAPKRPRNPVQEALLRPRTSPVRIQAQHPQVTVVHLPTHASWLNQVELYFSIPKRKALHPANFRDLQESRWRIKPFQCSYNTTAEPFRWNHTRADLAAHVKRLKQRGWLPTGNPLVN